LHEPISPSHRYLRRILIALLVVVVYFGAVGGLKRWNVNEYSITPGNATPVEPLVKVEGLPTDVNGDKIMLTDVYLQSLSAWQYLALHFQRHVQFVNATQLLDPGIPNGELVAQGFLEMSDSKQDAEVSAFTALGWKIARRPDGAVINGVIEHSPARAAGLQVADDIVGVNGTTVRDRCQLIATVHSLVPGSLVTLHYLRAHISATGRITWTGPVTRSMRTATVPPTAYNLGCPGIPGGGTSWLGISLENGVGYSLPASIAIKTKYIGGPSAGLAMTLSLIDELSKGSLTGHHKIAATGTIDQHGNVGDVGGVAEKTVAVQDAGAKYFFVPKVEVATARASASPGLTIIGVTTLSQALADLRSIGGADPVPLTTPR
jgi:PDZ domain-containing protein